MNSTFAIIICGLIGACASILWEIKKALDEQHNLLTRIGETLTKGMNKQIGEFDSAWQKRHIDEILLKALKEKEEGKK